MQIKTTSVLSGIAVTGLSSVVKVVTGLASVAILSRLVSPEDFGYVATAGIIIGFAAIFRDFGLSSASIQSPTLSIAQRDNLFWLSTGLGALLTIIVAIASIPAAAFWGNQKIGTILIALSISFLLSGITTQYHAMLNRELRFIEIAIADSISPLVSLAIAVLLGFLGYGWIALVVQQLSGTLINLSFYFFYGKWIPGKYRKDAPMRSLLTFGLNMFVTQIIHFFGRNWDQFLISKFIGPVQTGIYNRSMRIVQNSANQLTGPLNSVAIPVLSRIQDDSEKVLKFVTKAQTAIAFFVCGPLFLGAVLSPEIVDIFLGSAWNQAVPIISIICLNSALNLLAVVGYWLYVSQGKVSSLSKYTLTESVIRWCSITIGLYWGLNGVAMGLLAASIICYPLSLVWVGKVIKFNTLPLIGRGYRTIVMLSFIALVAYWAVRIQFNMHGLIAVIATSGIFLVAYFAIAFIPKIGSELRESLNLIKSFIPKKS